ncbi:kazrin-like isoform X4 [Lytechinus variegatus]|uniref:kazrin-like isoform X4 n=1 Tax=Lytechinus variegatus TaxID=7654 RepID=UPI001BB191CF|nr:kazrin-like isoform X4 [Lytechinus variegatus]
MGDSYFTPDSMGSEVDQKKSVLLPAIQSLDSLNDQIVQFIFTPKSAECDVSGAGTGDSLKPLERDSLKSNLALMRRLLVDAQAKFHRMMDDNKKLAAKIDNSLQQNANHEVDSLREELADTNKRLSHMSTDSSPTTPDNDQDNKEWQKQQDQHELQKLRDKCARLEMENKSLLKQVDDAHILEQDQDQVPTAQDLKIQLTQTEHELARAKEALTAMKADRKRLKSEKVDLLNQMKQLYCTLEAKEEEMRDFIRNYEQRMTESDASLKKIVAEKEEVEKDRWEILKRAREAAERSVALREQLDKKEKENESLEEELEKVRRQLISERNAPRIMLSNSSSVNDSMILASHCRDGSIGSDSVLSQGPDAADVSNAGSDLPETPPLSARSVRNTHSFISVQEYSADSESREFLLSPAEHLSRSSEELCNIETASTTSSRERFKKRKQKKFNSLSKIFGKKNRATLEQIVFDDTNLSSSRHSSTLELFSLDEQEKARLAEKCKSTPMSQWKANMVVAWLELTMCLPQYSKACAENIKSGKVLLGLSDSELDTGMGVTNVLHRRKLRLAIDQNKVPSECKFPKAADLDHCWVARTWLNDLGLGQHSLIFEAERVDGRVLSTLTKRDLEKYLKVTRKFHQASLLHGIELLRMLKFNKAMLSERRTQSEDIDMDPLVWTTQRVMKWARSIDLIEYADNLVDSGVHGALMVLEPSFDSDAMANALGIPSSKNIIRRHLTTELNALVLPARASLQPVNGTMDARHRRASSGALGGGGFQRSYNTNGEGRSKPTFRGSLGRALGRKLRQDMNTYNSSFGAMPEQIRSKSRSQEFSQESTIV